MGTILVFRRPDDTVRKTTESDMPDPVEYLDLISRDNNLYNEDDYGTLLFSAYAEPGLFLQERSLHSLMKKSDFNKVARLDPASALMYGHESLSQLLFTEFVQRYPKVAVCYACANVLTREHWKVCIELIPQVILNQCTSAIRNPPDWVIAECAIRQPVHALENCRHTLSPKLLNKLVSKTGYYPIDIFEVDVFNSPSRSITDITIAHLVDVNPSNAMTVFASRLSFEQKLKCTYADPSSTITYLLTKFTYDVDEEALLNILTTEYPYIVYNSALPDRLPPTLRANMMDSVKVS